MSEGDIVVVKYGKDDYHRAKLIKWVDDEQVEVEWLDDTEFEGSTTVVNVNTVHMAFDKRIKLGKRKSQDDPNEGPKRTKREIYCIVEELRKDLEKVREENNDLRKFIIAQSKDFNLKMNEQQVEMDGKFDRFIKSMEQLADDVKKSDDMRISNLHKKLDGVIEFAKKSAKFNMDNFKSIHKILTKN